MRLDRLSEIHAASFVGPTKDARTASREKGREKKIDEVFRQDSGCKTLFSSSASPRENAGAQSQDTKHQNHVRRCHEKKDSKQGKCELRQAKLRAVQLARDTMRALIENYRDYR